MKSPNRRSAALIIFTGLLIVIVNLTWWLFYFNTEKSFEQQLSRRLNSLATLGASGISPADLDSLSGGYLTSYDKILGQLDDIKQSDSLSEVFIIDADYDYLVTTLLNNDSVYYLASLNRPAIEAAFYNSDETGATVSATYRSGNLILKSAFTPLFDTLGAVGAVLGVEADVDYADDLFSLRQSLYLSTGFSVGIGILFGILLLLVQRKISRAEKSVFMSQSQANLGRMVAVVSHEIKNPLMIMRASAESLKKKNDQPEAEFILEEIDRLNRIVTGYLDFASGKMILKKEEIVLNDLFDEISQKFGPRFQEKKILLSIKGSENKLSVTGDPIALRQVIINLLLNAADAVADLADPEISIEFKAQNGKVGITVKDNGPGIVAKNAEAIFEPFFTTKTSGSGLGLFHSRRLIEEMGGSLTVDGTHNKLNEFKIVLPGSPGGF